MHYLKITFAEIPNSPGHIKTLGDQHAVHIDGTAEIPSVVTRDVLQKKLMSSHLANNTVIGSRCVLIVLRRINIHYHPLFSCINIHYHVLFSRSHRCLRMKSARVYFCSFPFHLVAMHIIYLKIL